MDENFKAYSGPRGISFQIVKTYSNLQSLVEDFNSPNCIVNYGEYAMIDASLLNSDNFNYIEGIEDYLNPLVFALNCELHPIFGNNGKIFQRIRPIIGSYYYDTETNYIRSKNNLEQYPDFLDTSDVNALPIARGDSDDPINVAPHTRYIGRVQGPTLNNANSIDGSIVTIIDDSGESMSLLTALNDKAEKIHTHSTDDIFYNTEKLTDTIDFVKQDLDTKITSEYQFKTEDIIYDEESELLLRDKLDEMDEIIAEGIGDHAGKIHAYSRIINPLYEGVHGFRYQLEDQKFELFDSDKAAWNVAYIKDVYVEATLERLKDEITIINNRVRKNDYVDLYVTKFNFDPCVDELIIDNGSITIKYDSSRWDTDDESVELRIVCRKNY